MYQKIDMTNLRTVLNNIFFTDDSMLKYIVPLQGNWYTPTLEDPSVTWIGYNIDTIKTDTSIVPQINSDYIARICTARIHLSFIGNDAEELIHGILFWNIRQDVDKILDDSYKAKINYKDLRIYTSLYMQEGKNSQLCWNIDLDISYNELYKVSNQKVLSNIILLGTINKE